MRSTDEWRNSALPALAYRGSDRRAHKRAVFKAPVAGAVVVVLAPLVLVSTSPARHITTTTMATIALTLASLVGLVACLARRAVGDQRLAIVGVALIMLGIVPVFVAGFLAPSIVVGGWSAPSALVASVPPSVLLALAPLWPAVDTRRWAIGRALLRGGAVGMLVAASSVPTLGTAVVVATTGGGALRWLATPGLAGVAVACVAVSVLYGARARRDDSELLAALGLVPLGGGLATAAAALGAPHAAYGGWGTMSVALVSAAIGVVVALQRAHRTERRRVLAALSRVEQLEAVGSAARISRADIHDLRSGLLTLEGAIDHLADDPCDRELMVAIAAEVARLRTLVEPVAPDPAGTDAHLSGNACGLRAALLPVLTCARAAGLPVQDRIGDDVRLSCDPAVAAQVVHGLLANVARHAPGSPVEVVGERDGNDVIVRVADHGKGLAPEVRDHLFEAGVHASTSPGEGLGLAHARGLARAQHGQLNVIERCDGVTFELRLPAVPTAGL